jgi:hypothetical protein
MYEFHELKHWPGALGRAQEGHPNTCTWIAHNPAKLRLATLLRAQEFKPKQVAVEGKRPL